jgi:hypothetical protein
MPKKAAKPVEEGFVKTGEAHTNLVLRLKSWEHKEILEASVNGGQLGLRDRLLARFSEPDQDRIYAIELPDELTGEIIRHMAYGKGNGGWQKRLAAAFLPAIRRATGTV